MRRLALLAFLVGAPAALANMPPPRAECTADTDCTLTQWEGCCGTCCPISAYPVAKAELKRRQNVCAAVDCARPDCKATPCAPGDDGSRDVAVCRLGRCARQSRAEAEVPRVPPTLACEQDSDCVVSTFSCCGACCEPPPRAMNASAAARLQNTCALANCRAPINCDRVRCAQPRAASDFQSLCQRNMCRLVSAPRPPAAQCTQDADCVVTYPAPGPGASCHRSPCGCCPGSEAVAVPVTAPRPPPPPRRPAQTRHPTPEQNAPFGLSTGDTANRPTVPQPVACAACPAPPPARATCQAGRCLAVPVRHLRK